MIFRPGRVIQIKKQIHTFHIFFLFCYANFQNILWWGGVLSVISSFKKLKFCLHLFMNILKYFANAKSIKLKE